MFPPLDADLSAITKQMVDMEMMHAMPSTSSGKHAKPVGICLVATGDKKSGQGNPGSVPSGNITPSSPGSEADEEINTNEATRGESTFEMVRQETRHEMRSLTNQDPFS